jgi:prepilin-type N-terminal cleavage/methylation domain-containing protein
MRTPENTGRLDATGFTLVELLITVAIIGILATVTIPSLLRAKMSGNEVSAIGSLRTINTAEAAYADTAASGAYATQLAVLTQPCPGSTQGFLSTEFAADPSQKSGYVIVLDPGSAPAAQADCNGVNARRGYYLTGEPISANRTGVRSFATSSAGAIYFSASGAPPTEAQILPGGGATPLQ